MERLIRRSTIILYSTSCCFHYRSLYSLGSQSGSQSGTQSVSQSVSPVQSPGSKISEGYHWDTLVTPIQKNGPRGLQSVFLV